MALSLNNSNKDFDFVGWVIKTPWLVYFRSVKFHYMWKKHTDVNSVLALVKIDWLIMATDFTQIWAAYDENA